MTVQSSVSGDRFVWTPAVSPPPATQDSQVFKSKGIRSAHGLVCCLQSAGSSWCCLSPTLAAKLPFPFQFVSSKWVLFCFCQSFLFLTSCFCSCFHLLSGHPFSFDVITTFIFTYTLWFGGGDNCGIEICPHLLFLTPREKFKMCVLLSRSDETTDLGPLWLRR